MRKSYSLLYRGHGIKNRKKEKGKVFTFPFSIYIFLLIQRQRKDQCFINMFEKKNT